MDNTQYHNVKRRQAPPLAKGEIARVSVMPNAEKLLDKLVKKHGAVMFHQSGGCCDGSSPMCYPWGEMILGEQDIYLGAIKGTPVFIGAAQFELWAHTHLIMDAVEGRGAGFSIEAPEGMRFITRSRLFDETEKKILQKLPSPPNASQLQWFQ